ncbi:MAG: Crp/Fnr family transcriptional regulator [Saprospiraceae bacterium]|nr:Crp/Fnr family transcriptional regulator [Saprospiraceae bacterium]
MSCQRLIDNFRQHIPLLPEEEQLICSLFSPRSFRKGQMINTEGEINRYTNFITQGSARVYYLDHSGQEHVIQLAIAGWWIGDYPSFITQQPGHLFTQALQQTEVLSLSYDNQQLLYERIPKTERFFRLLTQRAYVAFQKRMLQNLSMDAEGRYRTFRETYPDMDQQISQKHIASYLGMSAEFLSKIKKRMLKKSKPGQI